MTLHTVLIANRGEIARRVIRTAKMMGLRTVSVYADPDRTEPHVREADVAVPLRGETVTDTYLDIDQLIAAAEWQGADAIHPGYGFLAENASFARAVTDAGITWVGSPAAVINQMGDKLAAKQAAQAAGLPTLDSAPLAAGAPSGWHTVAESLGYPVMIKAAAGGGGRGMRIVSQPDALVDAVESASREAAASFGDATLYAERWLAAPRHIEIQIAADRHGNVVHLGERECSIQRRHQKLIEEAPSAAIGAELRDELGTAACELARSIGYEGLGTVELLVDDQGPGGPSWWFLEMNTRIQVEHPVTEAVWSTDLVRIQLLIADGQELPCTQADLVPSGHAIEARICAEDPAEDWSPRTGTILRFDAGAAPGLRWDSGVETGSKVGALYDSLLVKAIAHAPSREEATAKLVRGLRELVLHGPVTTRGYLIEVLGSEAFGEAETRTDFVDLHPPVQADDAPFRLERAWQRVNTITGPHLSAAALVAQERRQRHSTVSFAPTGWRNVGGVAKEIGPDASAWRLLDAPVGTAAQSVSYLARVRGGTDQRWDLTYTRLSADHPLERRRRSERPGEPTGLFSVAINGPSGDMSTIVELEPVSTATDSAAPTSWMLHFGRRSQQVEVSCYDDNSWFVNSALGQSSFVELERFVEHDAQAGTGGVVAPLPGRVVSVEVAPGEQVAAGATLVVLEAMKVEHRLQAPFDAVVSEVFVSPGDTVEAQQPLVQLEQHSQQDGDDERNEPA